jgi:hypothetical protein
MELECPVRVPSAVVSDDEGRNGHKAQENDCCNDTVRNYDGMVPSHILESIAHA